MCSCPVSVHCRSQWVLYQGFFALHVQFCEYVNVIQFPVLVWPGLAVSDVNEAIKWA